MIPVFLPPARRRRKIFALLGYFPVGNASKLLCGELLTPNNILMIHHDYPQILTLRPFDLPGFWPEGSAVPKSLSPDWPPSNSKQILRWQMDRGVLGILISNQGQDENIMSFVDHRWRYYLVQGGWATLVLFSVSYPELDTVNRHTESQCSPTKHCNWPAKYGLWIVNLHHWAAFVYTRAVTFSVWEFPELRNVMLTVMYFYVNES